MDAVVIGGGIVGCAIALAARRAGLDVAVVERGRVCGEASSAAAGLLCAQYDADADTPLFRFRLDGRDAFGEFAGLIQELSGADIGYRKTPTLRVVWTPEHWSRLKARVTWQREAGLAAELLGPEDVRRLEPGVDPSILGGALFAGDVQVNVQVIGPPLHKALLAAGVKVYAGAEVVQIPHPDRPGPVVTTQGPLECGQVVVAAGAWSGVLVPDLRVGPLKGQMAAVDGSGLELRHVINSPDGTIAQRTDGRIVVGATQENAGFDRRHRLGSVKTVLDAAVRLVPQLRDRALDGVWVGFRPLADDGLPAVGFHEPSGTIVATGHFTHGITMSWLTGRIVARLLRGEDPGYPIAPFDPNRFARRDGRGM